MLGRTLVALALATSLGGCGDSLDVNNVDPSGSVGGIVVDAVTRAPIEGATLSVLAGGDSFDAQTTDATGTFSFDDVPAGDVLVSVAGPEGSTYQAALIRDTMPAAAGEFPISGSLTLGPIGLVPMSASFTARVLDLSGRPVSDYTVTARTFAQWVDISSGTGVNRGEIVMQATTDGSGYLSLSPFPDFFALGGGVSDTLHLSLPPNDSDGDMINDFAGGTQTLSLRSLGDVTPDIILDPSFSTQLTIRASTIGNMVSGGTNPTQTVVGISDSLHFTFNLPIEQTVDVTVVDEQGTALDPQPGIAVSDDNLTVAFGSAPLAPGEEYNVVIHAVSAVGEVRVSGDFPGRFFTAAINPTVTVVNINRDPTTQQVDIEFDQPIGPVTSLSGANCVLFFAADLGGDIAIGDIAGELGNANCNSNHTFASVEPNPGGIYGTSGYTKFWRFTAPLAGNGNPLLSNTRVHIMFSHVTSTASIVERPDGSVVDDFTDTVTMSIPLP
jgi:hypothetical protein